ncbi:MAG: cytochrome c biogenesis protein ResB [Rikenellaceae bacterium]
MQKEISRKIWQAPWGYPESFAIVGGILFIGVILQLVIGGFDFYLLVSPSNLIVGAVIALLSVVFGVRARKSGFAKWLSGAALCVALLSAILLLTIIMGLIPQMTHSITPLGFEAMTSNWAFVILYTLLLVSLGALIIRRLTSRFIFRNVSFALNHIGLWLLLFSSGLGYADIERYIMYVNEGETEWRVYNSQGDIKELPIAITLNDFSMEFYPSRMVMVDTETGEIQNGDTTLLSGNDRYRSVMTVPEPRSFTSDVDVYTEEGEAISALIEVNSPLKVGSWWVYQYGYDNNAGNRSSYSSFELVYDGWLTPVYIGIILMMLGSVAMLWSGRDNS